MRLFVAVRLSEEMKQALTDAQRAMLARGVRGTYSPEENLHLTLAFIGEYPDAQPVRDALESVRFAPFAIRLDGVGRFGDLWWAGVEASAPLAALARRVRRALADNNIPFDRKRFSPHITLVRKAEYYGETPLPPVHAPEGEMEVTAILLMRSDRGKHGMIYTEIGRIGEQEKTEL